MTTLSLSESILRELSRHSKPMTARRIATAISHDLHRTRALISFMIGGGKLFAAGMDDTREQTYGLTDHGAGLARTIEGAGQHVHKLDTDTRTGTDIAPPPAPALIPETDTAQAAAIKHDPRPLEPLPDRRKPRVDDGTEKMLGHYQRPLSRVRFGMLNTGELVFIARSGLTITLPSDDLAALRDMIKAQP